MLEPLGLAQKCSEVYQVPEGNLRGINVSVKGKPSGCDRGASLFVDYRLIRTMRGFVRPSPLLWIRTLMVGAAPINEDMFQT